MASKTQTLEIKEELAFQKNAWIVQRIMWALMMLIVLAGLFGLFGKGYLSQRNQDRKNSSVQYEYFGRYQSPTIITIKWNTKNRQIINILFDQEFMRHYQIDAIIPAPQMTEIQSNTYKYSFNTKSDTNSYITFHLEPQKQGFISGNMVVDGDKYLLKQFIYP